MTDVDPYALINLGQKRKSYNESAKYGIDTNQPIISVDIQGQDVEKMMNIDIACAKADLPFVLNTLAHEDMLYVSRTIKNITWMITNQKYATIFHPEYLQANVLPKMTAKAANKLMKHIRLHLKDESRVEAFYNNEKNVTKALKWLPNCSVPFIEQEIKKHAKKIDLHLLKRLSEKSTSIWKIAMTQKDINQKSSALRTTLFILYKDADKFMDVIEETKWYERPDLGIRGTRVIMETNSERVIEKIVVYMSIIDIPTFARCLKPENVKDVLYKIADECDNTKNRRYCNRYSIFDFQNLKCFIHQMPFNERYKFVKDVFIDKIHSNKVEEQEVNKMAKLYSMCQHLEKEDYVWYQFGTFEEAFTPIKDCIQKETRQDERNSMLRTLLYCARSNMKYVTEVLQYFNDKLINDKLIDKHDFIYQILSTKKLIHKYDNNTWALLHEVLKSAEVYKESTDVSQKFIEVIIIYNVVVKNEKVPASIEKKFEFNTLKEYGNQMNQVDKDKLFTYLYNYSFAKLESCKCDSESNFKDKNEMLYKVLITLKDWKKDLANYPILLEKIRECIKIKHENSWKTDLSHLYNANKSWKRYMFEESLILSPTEEVCINALKHDADLLKRNQNVLLNLTRNDKVSLQRLLSKVRIFWNQTLAKDWAEEYLNRLYQADGIQAAVRGLCTILPQNQLLDIIKAYAPEKSEINWEETDSIKICIQRNFAKKMHSARPQPPPEAVMSYAKGDYLQFALPSILAIFYNLSQIKTREYIPKLFDAPVSLQKHGLRLAFTKMEHKDVINTFNSIWKTSKNTTIRAVIFKLTFQLISKEKDAEKLKELGNFLNIIIKNLSFEEDSAVYELLGEVDKVPISIRPQYIEQSYYFLKKMLPLTSGDDHKNLEKITERILQNVQEKMQYMCPIFVTKLLQDYIEDLNVKPFDEVSHGQMKINMLSKFLLLSDSEEKQNEKFNALCKAYIERAQKPGNKSLITRLQASLRENLINIIQSGMVIPEKIFSQLYEESLKILPITEYYVVLTELKLFASLMKVLKQVKEENKMEYEEEKKEEDEDEEDSKIKEYLTKIMIIAAREFGNVCASYLREDIDVHFPLIYELFSKSLINVYESLSSLDIEKKSIRNGFCTSMLHDKDFKAAYLVVLKVYSNDADCSIPITKPENKVLLNLILENESVEVRMHYNNVLEYAY